MNKLESYLKFIKEVELLKTVHRTAWTSANTQESTAEHSWRLALFCGLMLEEFPTLDGKKFLMMALIHDLGELYDGDISAALLPDNDQKYKTESAAVIKLFSLLPPEHREKYQCLWQEYEEGKTPEAKLVKALDKAETIIQHNQGINPPDFDYRFNLEYGSEYFEENDLLIELRRLLDEDTKNKIFNS